VRCSISRLQGRLLLPGHDQSIFPIRTEVTASVRLLDRPSACILWIFFDPDTLLLGPFLWFGGAAGEKIPPLGDKIAKHTKPNALLEKADRPAHRVVPKSRFAKLETIEAVIQKLIGV